MKKTILILVALFGAIGMEARVILYYGSSKITGNSVECAPTKKLCAVIIILGEPGPTTNGNKGMIQIYDQEGNIQREETFSDYFVTPASSSSAPGTKITWLP